MTLIESRQVAEKEFERARTSKISSNKRRNPTNCEVSSLGLRRQGSVTNNFLAVARKFSRPRLATSRSRSVSAPPFSLCRAGKRKSTSFAGTFSFTAPAAGIEPATNRLTGDCSTAELHRNVCNTLLRYSYKHRTCL